MGTGPGEGGGSDQALMPTVEQKIPIRSSRDCRRGLTRRVTEFPTPGQTGRPIEALFVEDNPADALMIRTELEDDLDIRLMHVARLSDAVEAIATRSFDVLLTDLNLPDSTGLATFERLNAVSADIPVIVLTGLEDPDTAKQILRAGAQDYVMKGAPAGQILSRAVRHAIERHHVHAQLTRHARELAESEARVRSIIDMNADAVMIVDAEGIVRFANPAAERMFGHTAGALVGHPLGFPITASAGRTTELDFAASDGTIGIAGLRVADIMWDGAPAVLASLRDITARASTEAALKDALVRLQAVVSNAPIFLWALDVDGRLTICEGRLLEKLGAKPGAFVGQSVRKIFKSYPGVVELAEKALRGTSEHANVEVANLTVEVWYTPMTDDEGRFVGTIGVGIDVTEQVRLESQFRQAQRMEAVGRLAGGIAHDFNNLLTVILSFAALAIDGSESLPAVRADLEQIQEAGLSASRLTKQLLAFSRRQIVQAKVLDLGDEVLRLEQILNRVIGEDIQLSIRHVQTPALIHADPGQIEQIVLNLAVNARDAMPGGGRLTIEVATVDLDEGYAATHHEVAPGRYVMLAVSDTGQGMTEETRRQVFEPFFTTKGVGHGTGLGLATVFGIVKQFNGSIWVYSEVGRGTVFKIYLPEVSPQEHAVQEEAQDETAAGGETILVVEDEEPVRRAADRVLTGHGYSVLLAENGAEALEIASKHGRTIQLVLSDVVMPAMSGRELADALRAVHPNLRIVFMSGYTDDSSVLQGILNSGVAFVQKPFTRKSLLKRVRESLDGAAPD